MALDDVVPSTAADAARFEEATHRTTRWIDRCIAAHSRPHEQNLFAIVQVGRQKVGGMGEWQEQGGLGWPSTASARPGVGPSSDKRRHSGKAWRHFACCGRPPLPHCGTRPQGGLDEQLRELSLRGLVERDTPGYAIGGLAGGEDKRSFVRCLWAAATESSRHATAATFRSGLPGWPWCPSRPQLLLTPGLPG